MVWYGGGWVEGCYLRVALGVLAKDAAPVVGYLGNVVQSLDRKGKDKSTEKSLLGPSKHFLMKIKKSGVPPPPHLFDVEHSSLVPLDLRRVSPRSSRVRVRRPVQPPRSRLLWPSHPPGEAPRGAAALGDAGQRGRRT